MPQYLIFIDLETGGFNWWKHRHNTRTIFMHPIIQVKAAAVEIPGWRIVQEFERKIQFDIEHADPEALQKNGYNAESWSAQAVNRVQAINDLIEFIKPYQCVEKISKAGKPYKVAMIAGHNVAGFDIHFLRAWFVRAKKFAPFEFHCFDTMPLAVARFCDSDRPPADYKLDTVCRHVGLSGDDGSAMGEVRATVRLAQKLASDHPKPAMPKIDWTPLPDAQQGTPATPWIIAAVVLACVVAYLIYERAPTWKLQSPAALATLTPSPTPTQLATDTPTPTPTKKSSRRRAP